MTWDLDAFVGKMVSECDPRDGLIDMLLTRGHRVPDGPHELQEESEQERTLRSELEIVYSDMLPWARNAYRVQELLEDWWDAKGRDTP